MDDLVSIIVLTWNRVELLKETVDALLAQTYSALELVIVDNESTDGTPEYVAALADPRIQYHRNANGGNLAVNRNYAIRRARGRYITHCDDDDLWLPDKLENQMRFLKAHPEYKVVSTNSTYFDEHGDIGYLIDRRTDADLTLADFLKAKNDVVLASVLIDKEVFEDVGDYSEDQEIVNTEDFEFMVRVAAAGYPMRFLAEARVRYRIHSGMASHPDTLKTIRKERRFFEKLYEREILDASEYKTVRKNLSRKYARAYMKERLKKSAGMKNMVFRARRARMPKDQGEG